MKPRRQAMLRVATRRQFILWVGALAGTRFAAALEGKSDAATPQPYFAAVSRALEALAKVGAPVTKDDAQQIAALARQGDQAAVEAAERILNRYTLVRIVVETGGPTSAVAGGAQRTLIEHGWRAFLVRVSNPKGIIAAVD